MPETDPASNKEQIAELAIKYLDFLLNGDRFSASQLVLNAVNSGVAVRDIYLGVFQHSQYEIGRLWQTNQVSVAQEHYCTAATQLIMSQLYPFIFNSDKSGRRLVATCVGGELHEIGVRMVADFFEMEGWDTYYLGANTPAKSILESIESNKAHVLAISATITSNINTMGDLISDIRKSTIGREVKILVGGRPFNIEANLWKMVNADGFSHDAQSAISLANTLFVN